MILKIRDNIFMGDKTAHKEFKKGKITTIVIVADNLDITVPKALEGVRVFKFPISADTPTPSYIKDLAAHTPKYLAQYGEKVLVQSVTGYKRAAYIASRVVCEIESKSIYEVLQEVQEKEPKFDIGGAYL